ncbi:hypothetical protein L0337_35110 [candidate division KSB1 bacterium]|nr:hypothetical protein [candidate division KSB1 bacterium]
MNEERPKSVEVVGKLTQLTQQGKIEWKEIGAPASFSHGKDTIIDFAYVTDYKNRKLIIYQQRKKNIHHDITGEIIISWEEPKTALEIIDENFKVLWTFPWSRNIDDLLYSIRFKLEGIKDFFDKILDDK